MPAQAAHLTAPFILDYIKLKHAQSTDNRLLALHTEQPNKYPTMLLAPDTRIICYLPTPHKPWKIYLPDALLQDTVQWYHTTLGHLGISRLYDTLSLHLYNPDLRTKVADLVSKCDSCQRAKILPCGYGRLAPREVDAHPWRKVAVDLIGPWTLKVGDQRADFMALTIIDVVTNLVELVRIDNKSSAHVAMHFENTWLLQYPRPSFCIYDQGGNLWGFLSNVSY